MVCTLGRWSFLICLAILLLLNSSDPSGSASLSSWTRYRCHVQLVFMSNQDFVLDSPTWEAEAEGRKFKSSLDNFKTLSKN